MANPPKKKGTAAETELLRKLNALGYRFVRTPPGTPWDLEQYAAEHMQLTTVIEVLATRPDRGQWLFSMPMMAFVEHLTPDMPIRIEVKRYARFALHNIFEKKFGRKA